MKGYYTCEKSYCCIETYTFSSYYTYEKVSCIKILTFSGYYTCEKGYCIEIYDLKCERRCDSLEFNMKKKNSVIFSGERIIIADCSTRSTPTDSRIDSVITHNAMFFTNSFW